MYNSILMAFSLYSRIPVPRPKWKEKNLRYCICFFPLVGAVIGGLQGLAFYIMMKLPFGTVFRAAVLTSLPLFLSGGIHMDGFLDTCDAVHSYKEQRDRLEILKDPNVGAFAVLGGIVWTLFDFGVWSEADSGTIVVLCLCFVLSRALSALTALTFPKAKSTGMLHSEIAPTAKNAPAAMAVVVILTGFCMIVLRPVEGTAALIAAFITLVYYRYMSGKMFGGITGDLSGWFTQMSELVMACAIIVFGRIL